jgi:4-amino-4-deoxy-L-arabinose transferase-like glycosyltransferase
MSSTRTWWVVAAIVVAVAVGRAGLVAGVHSAHPARAVDSNDAPTYIEPAQSILEDGEFDRGPDSEAPEFVRTPGYPAFLAAVFWASDHSTTAVVVLQALLSGLSVLLAILLGRRLSGSHWVGLGAGGVLALDPLQAATAGFVATESLATVLVAFTAYAAVRFAQSELGWQWGLAFAAGLVASTYVRPTTFYFVVVAAVLLGIKALTEPARRTAVLRAGAIALLPCVALLGAWNVRNRAEVGSWRFSAVEAINTYWYKAADAVARRDDISYHHARRRLTRDLGRDLGVEFDYDAHSHGTVPPEMAHDQGRYYDAAGRRGIEILGSQPHLTARQVVDGVVAQVVQSGWVTAYGYFTGQHPPAPVRALGLGAVWAVEGLALVGMALSLRRPPDGTTRLAHVFPVALLAYTVLAAAGPEADAGYRFRVPVWPIWCVYAAIGALQLVRLARTRRSPEPLPAL